MLERIRIALLPEGPDRMMLAAYAVILTAIISFLLTPATLPPWRFYGVLVALVVLLAMNLLLPSQNAPGSLQRHRSWAYLLLGGGVVFLANWLGRGMMVLPWLLFVLASQSLFMLPTRQAIVYGIVLAGLLTLTAPPERRFGSLLLMLSGLAFTQIFSMITLRYGEETARAEALLGELQAANLELEQARVRAHELAAAEERVRLAHEIHDGLGHHLTVLNVQLQVAEKLLSRDPTRAATALSTARQVADAALAEVRTSVAALQRSPLDGRTLDEALTTLVHDFNRAATLQTHLTIEGEPSPLPAPIAMTLYRAAQEGLTNAQKHASASRVAIALRFAPHEVQLQVADDGAQGEPRPMMPVAGINGGFGLAGLRERAHLLGGSFQAAPDPDGGFRVELRLPLEAAPFPASQRGIA